MRSAVCVVVVLLVYCWSPADAWGHIFSRFRPEAGGLGTYGGAGYGPGYEPYSNPIAERLVSPREQLLESLLREEEVEEQLCEGRRCTANEHCCAGHVCVDFDGASGTCMSSLGYREGGECNTDDECNGGLICDLGACTAPQSTKSYNELCSTSHECDVGRGLCCQIMRRHRQAPKMMCGYFKDPAICIGHVSTDKVKKDAGATKQ